MFLPFVAFLNGYTGTDKSKNKSIWGKSAEGVAMIFGVAALIIGFFIVLWVL